MMSDNEDGREGCMLGKYRKQFSTRIDLACNMKKEFNSFYELLLLLYSLIHRTFIKCSNSLPVSISSPLLSDLNLSLKIMIIFKLASHF